MEDKNKFKRGLTPENFVYNLGVIWRTSPGMRFRLYLGIAIGVFGGIWSIVSAILD